MRNECGINAGMDVEINAGMDVELLRNKCRNGCEINAGMKCRIIVKLMQE